MSSQKLDFLYTWLAIVAYLLFWPLIHVVWFFVRRREVAWERDYNG